MKTDIEKLKEERDSAINMLEEVMRPHGIYDQAVSTSKKAFADAFMETGDKIRATVEAFKPKAEPLERWVNVYPDGVYNFTHPTKEIAVKNSAEGLIRTAHLREVVPVEWDGWVVYGSRNITAKNGRLIYAVPNLYEICAAHNAEMKRATGTEGK